LPGGVVVAPSGFHTLITRDRTVALVRSGQHPPSRPSADLLFATLAVTASWASVTGSGGGPAKDLRSMADLGGIGVLQRDDRRREIGRKAPEHPTQRVEPADRTDHRHDGALAPDGGHARSLSHVQSLHER
jgi:hypothetical protein